MSARLPQALRSAPLIRSPLQLCCGRSVCDPRRKSRMSGRGGCQHGHPYRARGGIGKRIASTDVDLSALDSRNAMANEIACAAKVHFQTITGATNLQQEIGTTSTTLLLNVKSTPPPYVPPLHTTFPGQRRHTTTSVFGPQRWY